jgi:hypothetical protein
MEHPGEHSIELYVLRAPEGKPERERIEAHLQECAGCRDLADAVASFYTDLQVDILTHPSRDASASRSLAAVSGPTPVIFEPPFREAPLSRVRHAGFVRYVRAHPFVAGGGGLALLGGLAFLMLTFDLMPSRDRSLSTVIENQNSSTLDAYNRAGEKLWSCPVPHLVESLQQGRQTGRTYLQLADLNGDGRNELFTTYPVVSGEGEDGEVLHVLDNEQREIGKIRPGQTITCRGRVYPDEFHVGGFSVGDFSGTGRMEIIVLMNHLHSPSIVSRYDAAGNRLGTYRHFGQLSLMGTKPVADGPAREFVLYGASDTEEGRYAAVIVGLDPSRLTGDGESSYSGGFGLPHSAAEHHYLRIPQTEVAREFGLHVLLEKAKAVPLKDEEGFRILSTASSDSALVYFEYIFGSNFRLVEVKSSNTTEVLFNRLAAKGLLGGNFFDDYMKVVAGEVRYWDGRLWQARPTPVPH